MYVQEGAKYCRLHVWKETYTGWEGVLQKRRPTGFLFHQMSLQWPMNI